jgi:hypothetical protein
MVNEYFDGRLPVEITDMLKGLDKIIEHDARLLGQQEMQFVVLKWAVSYRDALSPEMRDSLILTMDSTLGITRRSRPAMAKPEQAVA